VRRLAGRLGFVAVVLALGWVPSASSAATCDDYSNQAEAQRAKDTRHADGIYCESLPCPCLMPGEDRGPTPKPKPTPKSEPTRPRPAPVALVKRTRGSDCRVRGPLPDVRCTPGSVLRDATLRVFCKRGYTKLVRHGTEATKRHAVSPFVQGGASRIALALVGDFEHALYQARYQAMAQHEALRLLLVVPHRQCQRRL
jgi:hypothetical protein